MLRGDWSATGEALAEDVAKYDRRQLGTPPTSGRAERLAELRVSFDTFAVKEWSSELVAFRGQRLALQHAWFVSEQDYVFEYLNITQLDEHGRVSLTVDFDVEDMDAALAELDDLASVDDVDA